MNQPLKGEIYWADLNPTIGSEITKTRPVLIVSNDISFRNEIKKDSQRLKIELSFTTKNS